MTNIAATQSLAGLNVGPIPSHSRGTACINGRFLPAAEATVSIFDHSFLYGDGAFESIACRRGRLFMLEPHVARLWASCQYLKIEIPLVRERVTALALETIARNEMANGDLRIVVSRGDGYPMSDPSRTQNPLVIFSVQEKPISHYPAEKGLSLIVAATRRTPSICLDPRVKSNNYLNHIMAKLEAVAAGADDAIMLDTNGHLAELAGCNIFVVSKGRLSTPKVGNGLEGITRATVLELAEAHDFAVVSEVFTEDLTTYDLYTADEVFVTGTGTGVAFAREVDGRVIGTGVCGPVAKAVGVAYEKLLDGD